MHIFKYINDIYACSCQANTISWFGSIADLLLVFSLGYTYLYTACVRGYALHDY